MDTLRDFLTGLYNRAVLHERLAEEIARARRYSIPLSLMVLDIDYFKSINDAFGHARGDEVLIHFANITEKALRKADILFRYGGDEFVVILPFTTLEEAQMVAQRLLTAVVSTAIPGEPPLNISVSIGVAEQNEELNTPETLFDRADQCAYAAKLAGRGRVASQPAKTGEKLAFDATSRLVERDEALNLLHAFVSRLEINPRGVMGVLGIPGSGRSRFLSDASKFVRLQGYVAWTIRTRPGLKFRAYGAFAESQPPWSDLPAASMGAGALAGAIQDRLTEHHQLGLVLLVEELANLDDSSLALVHSLLTTTVSISLAVIFSDLPGAPALLEAPMQETVSLPALSLEGTRMWLRSAMQWEAPHEFCLWLHQASLGYPGRLEAILTGLARQGYLVPQGIRWEIRRPYAEFSPPDPVDQRSSPQLPISEAEFVGREKDLAAVKSLIQEHRLVTLVAPGGMGKTRLALQVGWEMLDHFPNGVFWVDLTSVMDGNFIYQTIANALGLHLNGLEPHDLQVMQHLREKKTLLIFDNFEQLADSVGILGAFEQPAPQVKQLVTSRERLNVPGEKVYNLGGLPIPAALEGSSLLQLFQQSLSRVPGGKALVEAELPYVRRIGELVAGMPLGLKLAAAWVPLLGCQGVVEEIEHNLDLLTTTQQDMPERQRGLRAVFDAFWQSLMPDEQTAISRLAVFRGGFLRSAAQQAAGIKSFFFAALADSFYLTRTESGRYAIHEPLRQYLEEKLQADPEAYAESCRAHASYFMSLVEQSSLDLSRQPFWLKRLQEEYDNLRAALFWCLSHQRESALKLANQLRSFWRLRGYFYEGSRWIEAALLANENDQDLYTQTQARITAGLLHELLGNYPLAQERLQSGLEYARRTADEALMAEALTELGWLVHHHGENDRARQIAEDALSKARSSRQTTAIMRALALMSSIHGFYSEFDASVAAALESLALARQLDSHSDIVRALNMLGLMSNKLERLEQAVQYLEEGLAVATRLELVQFIAILSLNLGNVQMKRINLAQAEEFFCRAVELFRSVNERIYSAYAQCRLGIVCIAQNQLGLARRHLLNGLTYARSANLEPHVYYALSGLALWYARMEKTEQAVELLGFIQGHPKASTARNEVADPLLAELRQKIQATLLESGLKRGKELTLDEVLLKVTMDGGHPLSA